METPKAQSFPDSVPLTLVVPTRIQGTDVSVVQVYRLKVKDRMEAKKPSREEDQERLLVAKSLRASPDEVDGMDLADYLAVQEIMESFFSARRIS